MKYTIVLATILLSACMAPAYAAPVPKGCMANEAVAAKYLSRKHGEVLTHVALATIHSQHSGNHMMQIYVNPKTRTWTGIVVHPANEGGFACQAGSGKAWLNIKPAVGDPV